VLVEAGYAPSTALNPGSVLRKGPVSEALQLARELDERVATYGSRELRADLLELAEADVLEVFDEDGRLRRPSEWPQAVRRRVKTIKLDEYGNVASVTFDALLPILQTLGKHRDVAAFAADRVERAVFVIRDYTGNQGGAGHAAQGQGELGDGGDQPAGGPRSDGDRRGGGGGRRLGPGGGGGGGTRGTSPRFSFAPVIDVEPTPVESGGSSEKFSDHESGSG